MRVKRQRGEDSRARRGRLVAEALAGAWRASSPSLTMPLCELEEIGSLITTFGGGGLGWSKVRESDHRGSSIGEMFLAQYRYQTLRAAIHERNLKKAVSLLRDAGVESLLVKGWAIARLYPEPGMRPYLDLDLCVQPGDYDRAARILEERDCGDCHVDLHSGFLKFYDRRTEEIFARSQIVKLDDVDIRVLSPEDDLRFLSLHLLRHGGVQPLWLCDICVLLESQADSFNWDRCLSGSRRAADWISCAIGLAHQLFDIEFENTPIGGRGGDLPMWLLSTMLEEWGTPLKTLPQLGPYLSNPRRWLSELPKELPKHWPNPIEATMTTRGSFNRLPRLPFQIAHVISRIGGSLSDLAKGFGPGAFLRGLYGCCSSSCKAVARSDLRSRGNL